MVEEPENDEVDKVDTIKPTLMIDGLEKTT